MMDFWAYNTLYHKAIAEQTIDKSISYQEFYLARQYSWSPEEKRDLPYQFYVDAILTAAEGLWLDARCPYYRVFPPYIDIFAQTSLDVPSQYLQFPFKVFSVRFPKGHEPAVWERRIQAALFFLQEDATEKDTRALWVVLQLAGADGPYNTPAMAVRLRKDVTISDSLYALRGHQDSRTLTIREDKAFEDPKSAVESVDAFAPIFRIGMAIAFLATGGDKVIQADVLNKDLAKYLEAVNKNQEQDAQKLAEKATRRRNQIGFTIGRPRSGDRLLGQRSQSSGESEHTGRSLKFQHQRAGHIHRYWTGPGRTIPVHKFVSQVTVRPDLPPPDVTAAPKGFRTLKAPPEST